MRVLADEASVSNLIDSMAQAIAADIERDRGAHGWALVGIRSRGDVLAQRVAQRLGRGAIAGRVGTLDITLYRDDLSEVATQPIVRTTEVPFDVDGLQIVLLDDVLMTGRSIRAALQSLMDLGRPRRVWLGVLVDRGGRELPIAADHVGLDLKARALHPGDRVDVCLKPTDDSDEILLRSAQDREAA